MILLKKNIQPLSHQQTKHGTEIFPYKCVWCDNQAQSSLLNNKIKIYWLFLSHCYYYTITISCRMWIMNSSLFQNEREKINLEISLYLTLYIYRSLFSLVLLSRLNSSGAGRLTKLATTINWLLNDFSSARINLLVRAEIIIDTK